jgi:hypothetical protein
MGYYNNYLVDKTAVIVGVQAIGARISEESRAAEEMIAQSTQWQGKNLQSIAADASYGNGELLQWLMDRQSAVHAPRHAVARTRSPSFGPGASPISRKQQLSLSCRPATELRRSE